MSENLYRLMYVDSGGTERTACVIGGDKQEDPSGTSYNTLPDVSQVSQIKNAKLTYRLQEVDSLKIWTDNKLFGNIPLTTSEFQTGQTFYRFQKWDTSTSTWNDMFFGTPRNQGTINEDGEMALKLQSVEKRVSKQEADITITSSTPVETVVENILNDGSPSLSFSVENIDGNYSVSLDRYVLNDVKRKGLREITKQFRLGIKFLPDLDTNGNIRVQLVPFTYNDSTLLPTFASYEDFTSGDEYADFKEWEKGSVTDVDNIVRVRGVDGNNNVTEVVSDDQTSIDKYGERKKGLRVEYTGDSTVLTEIADSALQPEPPEGGRVKTPYTIDAEDFGVPTDVISSRRDVNTSLRPVKHEIFVPEGDNYVEFGFQEDFSESGKVRDDVDDERQSFISRQTEDLGDGDVSGDTGDSESDTSIGGDVDSDPSDTSVGGSVDQDPSDTAVSGSVQAEEPDIVQYDSGGFSGNYSSGTQNLVGVNLDQDGLVYTFKIEFNELDGTCSNFGNLGVGIRDGNGAVHFFENDVTLSGGTGIADTFGNVSPNYTVWYQKSISFININSGFFNLVAVLPNGGDLNGNFVGYVSDHSHGDSFTTDDNNHPHGDSFNTTDNTHPHGDSFSTSDLLHGGPDQPSELQHGVDGTANLGNVDIPDSLRLNRDDNA